MKPLLQINNISKRFGNVQALTEVSLEIRRGEVHAIIGENGAGKSTLMNILSGALQPDSGQIYFDGNLYAPNNPHDGRKAGIGMIYQELTLAEHLSVEENITLGLELTTFGKVNKQTAKVQEVLRLLGLDSILPSQKVVTLNQGQKQMVEIARALFMEAKVIVMDEPTSSLTASDTKRLFEVISHLKSQGITVLYISHYLEEVYEIGDSYTVLRDGEVVESKKITTSDMNQMIQAMVGRTVDALYPELNTNLGEVCLEITDLSGTILPQEVNLTLRRGQILGIAGLVGSGRSETIRQLFGLEQATSGQMKIHQNNATEISRQTVSQSLKDHLNLLSEDRKGEGLALGLSIKENLTLSSIEKYKQGIRISHNQERRDTNDWIQKMGIKASNYGQKVHELSGGNQQKVCIARILHQESDILLLDEPTRGIDIASKAAIYELIASLAKEGKAIILVSSYLPELFGMADTLAVMFKGRLSPIKPTQAWTDESVMYFATTGNELQEN